MPGQEGAEQASPEGQDKGSGFCLTGPCSVHSKTGGLQQPVFHTGETTGALQWLRAAYSLTCCTCRHICRCS